MSSLTRWVKKEGDYSLFLLHVNPLNNNLAGRQCFLTGKFTLDRCFKKAALYSWDMLNGLISFFSFLLPTVRNLFTFCKLVVLFSFSPWLLKLSRPLKHYIRRGSCHLGNVGCMTQVQVPVTLQPRFHKLVLNAQPHKEPNGFSLQVWWALWGWTNWTRIQVGFSLICSHTEG